MMQHVPGCELYIVNVSASEPDVVWVTEVWRSASDHQASLGLEEIKALIKRTMPLIAGGERIEIIPIAGKGLATELLRFKRCVVTVAHSVGSHRNLDTPFEQRLDTSEMMRGAAVLL